MYYDCYVSKGQVWAALKYKIKYDPYYKDVIIFDEFLQQLLGIDIWSRPHTIDVDNEHELSTEFEHPCDEDENENDITY